MKRNELLQVVIPMLNYYPDYPSGAARLAFDEAVFLAGNGHKVWVVTQDLSRSKPEYNFQDGLHVLRYPSPKIALFDPRGARVHQMRTRDLLSRYIDSPVGLVHGHSLLHYDGAQSHYGKTTKSCYSVHSPVSLEMQAGGNGQTSLQHLRSALAARIAHRIEHRCLEASDCITAESNYTKQLLGRLHGPGIQQRTQVIPGWVDLERFQIVPDRQALKSKLDWPTNLPVFFTLRRLVPRMGLDRLLYAVRMVKSAGRSFYLIVGGDGSLRNQLEALVEKLEIRDYVTFIGQVPEAQLPLMYGAADAFVLPTAELECFGLIALEALACGRPVLATPVGAIPEVLWRFEKGWLAHDASIEAITQLLIDFLRGGLPSHEPANLRAIVAEHYARELILDQLVTAATHAR